MATPDTERAWLERARGRTVREVEKLVAGRRPGRLPDDAAEPGLQRHVLRFEVSGEVLATFREALAKMRRDAGGPLDDDSALLLLARHVLAGPVDEGRASYQVELTVCEHCRRAQQVAQGEALDVATEVAAMARGDGQQLASANFNDTHVARIVTRTLTTRTPLTRMQLPENVNARFVQSKTFRPPCAPGATTRPASVSGPGLHARKFRGRSSRSNARRRRRPRRGQWFERWVSSRHVVQVR